MCIIDKLRSFSARSFVCAMAVSAGMANGEVLLDDARIRELPPGVTTTAAYMTLSNPDDEIRQLESIKADFASKIEVHEHSHENGVMRMRKVDPFIVSAGQSIEFKPGGYHLMVFGVKEMPRAPGTVDITLAFKNGETVTQTFSVYSHHQQHSH